MLAFKQIPEAILQHRKSSFQYVALVSPPYVLLIPVDILANIIAAISSLQQRGFGEGDTDGESQFYSHC